jgi:hypothetical protein
MSNLTDYWIGLADTFSCISSCQQMPFSERADVDERSRVRCRSVVKSSGTDADARGAMAVVGSGKIPM